MLALAGGLVCARGGEAAGRRTPRRELVPAGALAYVHLSTDPGRAADARSRALAGALPPPTRLRDQLVAAVAPQALDVERDVRPWLGGELAYAAVSPADSLVLAAVADRAAGGGARRAGRQPRAAPRATAACSCCVAGATALAFVGDFLALGTEPAVRAAIDREQGEGDAPRRTRGATGARSADAPAEPLARRPTRQRRRRARGARPARRRSPGLLGRAARPARAAAPPARR